MRAISSFFFVFIFPSYLLFFSPSLVSLFSLFLSHLLSASPLESLLGSLVSSDRHENQQRPRPERERERGGKKEESGFSSSKKNFSIDAFHPFFRTLFRPFRRRFLHARLHHGLASILVQGLRLLLGRTEERKRKNTEKRGLLFSRRHRRRRRRNHYFSVFAFRCCLRLSFSLFLRLSRLAL